LRTKPSKIATHNVKGITGRLRYGRLSMPPCIWSCRRSAVCARNPWRSGQDCNF